MPNTTWGARYTTTTAASTLNMADLQLVTSLMENQRSSGLTGTMLTGSQKNVAVKTPLPEGAKEFYLYGDTVRMVFRPDIAQGRYKITDHKMNLVDKITRGVTTLIGDILDKPELRTWPLNMSNQALFGAIYKEDADYEHDWDAALIQPGVEYDDETLHELMLEGSRQWTLKSDKGKDVGTMAHNAIEQWLRDEDIVFPDDAEEENVTMAIKSLRAFQDWFATLEAPEILEIEKPVYSRQMQYAGTFDLLMKIGTGENRKTYLLDIKTTNASKKAPMGIYPEMFIQLGAYAYAYKEETGNQIYDVGIIRVGKDGKLNVATALDLGLQNDDCQRAFAFAVRLHDWTSQIKPFLSDARMTSHLNPAQSQVGDEPASK